MPGDHGVSSPTETQAPALSFETTISPREVFRSAPEQVMVTDHDWDPETQMLRVAAMLPRAHARWSDTLSPYHDIVLMAEVLSQTGVVGAARVLHVPLDSFFMPRQIKVVQEPLEHNRRGPDAVRMTLTVDVAASTAFKRRREGRPPGGWLRADCAIEQRPSGVCEVGCAWLTDELYEMLRGPKAGRTGGDVYRPDAEPEERTGRGHPGNTVITRLEPGDSPRTYRSQLLIDTSDPTFYDLPLDHVPGLMLLEAMRQAATASACLRVGVAADAVHIHAVDLTFMRFAEVDEPVEIETETETGEAPGEIAVRLRQSAKTLSEGTLGVTLL
jgi:2-oxo-3-(phosphooxy)propyl 3-oxoalkanoate synthase